MVSNNQNKILSFKIKCQAKNIFPNDVKKTVNLYTVYYYLFQYIRLCPTTDLELVWTLLTDHWRLPIPNLLISVTGGAQRFDLNPRLKAVFKRGLINAATTTGRVYLLTLAMLNKMPCLLLFFSQSDYLFQAIDTNSQT